MKIADKYMTTIDIDDKLYDFNAMLFDMHRVVRDTMDSSIPTSNALDYTHAYMMAYGTYWEQEWDIAKYEVLDPLLSFCHGVDDTALDSIYEDC